VIGLYDWDTIRSLWGKTWCGRKNRWYKRSNCWACAILILAISETSIRTWIPRRLQNIDYNRLQTVLCVLCKICGAALQTVASSVFAMKTGTEFYSRQSNGTHIQCFVLLTSPSILRSHSAGRLTVKVGNWSLRNVYMTSHPKRLQYWCWQPFEPSSSRRHLLIIPRFVTAVMFKCLLPSPLKA
jgi:hypothetical protein